MTAQATMDFAPATTKPQPPAKRLVEQARTEGQDFEFYPTTDAIIAALIRDMNRVGCGSGYSYNPFSSFLDIGAGNGKVLRAVRGNADHRERDTGIRDLYAIEKSTTLLQQLPDDILVIGTEFEQQSLLSKTMDVTFCNPPYSQFEAWAEKIIRQSASALIYLVIPERWQRSTKITDALRFREAEAKTVGEFTFEDAEDRKARAKVHLLRIELQRDRHGEINDAFQRFFNEQFADLIEKFKESTGKADEDAERRKSNVKRQRETRFASLVQGPSYPEALVNIYNEELTHIEKNYQLVAGLDVDLLFEFDISPDSIMKCLAARLAGLKNDYWQELFNRLGTVTDRLASKSRKALLETLHKHAAVDFTLTNILAVVIWVIKNANKYIDSQLIEIYEMMVDKCNVTLYKSNQRTWRDDQWRYCRHDEPDKPSRYALDYRIVTHRAGGVDCGGYSFDRGLEESGANFIGDLLTIARNLGFNCDTRPLGLDYHGRKEWKSGEKREFHYHDKNGARQVLFDIRGFKNRNIHVRFNQKFILALNVEFGRLKGWLHDAAEAVDELQDKGAAKFFKANVQIAPGTEAFMLLDKARTERDL